MCHLQNPSQVRQTTGFGELTLTLDHEITTGVALVHFGWHSQFSLVASLLDVLISITLGVSALPVNIIIGVIVVLGLGTAAG
ncbi:E3 UBIQUITIN-PROTEIN LIGASE MARCH11 ISOFORM X1 [Salix purpurea]|uniref:E3 UBIQUITIN-PROTEIN LIGASE MARCH11 ISOFORM X1 n=1 Tax=Salix purpurea TaxID=77065 RepID=A0A9Q1A061_SALPP|nr:E3 UBIQUITIN-PROTEIN LIGASE MARCH11 ISOFORM X1 [Salix purpurea]